MRLLPVRVIAAFLSEGFHVVAEPAKVSQAENPLGIVHCIEAAAKAPVTEVVEAVPLGSIEAAGKRPEPGVKEMPPVPLAGSAVFEAFQRLVAALRNQTSLLGMSTATPTVRETEPVTVRFPPDSVV
jgi:hypothetical protein